jgi:hypothetical protein
MGENIDCLAMAGVTGGSRLGRFRGFAKNLTASSVIVSCAKLESRGAPTEVLMYIQGTLQNLLTDS